MPRIIKLAKGTYTSSTITVDGDGRVITASSGSAGGGTYVTTAFNSPGTFTPDPGTQYMFAMAVGGGGGSNNYCPQGTAGGTTTFGNLLSAPGGNKGADNNCTGGGGTYSSNIYWSVGKPSGSSNSGQGTAGGSVGSTFLPGTGKHKTTPQIGSLDGAGSGGNSLGGIGKTGAGSGGVAAAYYNSPQYPGTHTITIGTGGSPNGNDGRCVAVEFTA